jgi:hypothetical protein
MFLYAAACAVLLLGILGAVSVGSGETCPSGYFASDGTCISMSGMLGGPGNPNNPGQMVPSAPGPAPTKDEQLDVRTEIFLASAAVALIIASFAAKARRRDTAVVAAPAPPADAS